MNTLYILVITLWGLTAEGQWVYVGNQLVLNEPMQKEECQEYMKRWSWHEDNEYYNFTMSCEEA